MALALNNFIGFETGGLEEAYSVSGAPVVQSTIVKSGNFALALPAGAEYSMEQVIDGTSDELNARIISFKIYFVDTTPASKSWIFYAYNDDDLLLWDLAVETDGDLIFTDSAASTVTVPAPFTSGKFHRIDVFWEKRLPAVFELYIDGVSVISENDRDLTEPGVLFYYTFANTAGSIIYYDDLYCMSGASSVSDFLGPRTEVLGAFQNTVEDHTDQGSTLSVRSWSTTGNTPGVD
ncbi:unnamed protein product, partial [marine sediment metagenome]